MLRIDAGHIGEVRKSCQWVYAANMAPALKGSDHLEFILDNRLYRTTTTKQLEDLYEEVAPDAPDYHFVTKSQIEDGTAPKDELLLPAGNHNTIAKRLGVPELSSEVERAVWQVENALRKADEEQKQKQQ